MPEKDSSNESFTNEIIDSTMTAVDYQSQFVPEPSNLKQNQKDQTPREIIERRIQNEVRDLQIVAGMTLTQRKVLLAQLEILKLNMDQKKFAKTSESEVARRAKVSRQTVANFNDNTICQNALIACTNVIIKNAYPDIIAGLWKHGEYSYQALVKLLELVNLYHEKKLVETTNKNLNVNLEMGNSPDAIMRQVVVKFGSVGYDRDRFQAEMMAMWDSMKSEGAF